MLIIKNIKKFFSIILKHSAPVCLFIVLPMLVSLYLENNIINTEKENHFANLSTQIDNLLKDIESEVEPESFLLKIARGGWFTLNQFNNNLDNFWKYYDKLCSFLNSKPDFYLFNEKGDLITPNRISLKSRFLATKLWKTIDSNYDERVQIFTKYKKELTNFLGNEFKLTSFLEARNRLMPIIIKAKVGYVFWMNYSNNTKKGILIVFWEKPSFDLIFNIITTRYSSKFFDGFIKNSNGQLKPLKGNNDQNYNLNNSKYEDIFIKTVLMEQNTGYIDNDNQFWKSTKIGDLWLSASLKSNIDKYNFYNLFFKYSIILLALICIFLYIFIINTQKGYISIRTKLVVLFLFAVLTPVMGFSYLGYNYIRNMRKNLIANFGNEGRDVLLNIDRELGASGNVFRDDFRKMIEDFKQYDNNKFIQNKITNSIKTYDLAVIERRLASDASIIKQVSNKILVEDINSILNSFSMCCIDTMLNTNLMDSMDPVLKTTLTSPEVAFTSFQLGQITFKTWFLVI